ncbi:MAG: quinone-dependent dihydroorotate dehydrogenase [Proteobacteria bacterium]|nr:quinone-dependent dihydroorotate dehydrogenase [Pseudomonadota bacterium]
MLRRLDPECAHEATLAALAMGLAGHARWRPDPMLRVTRFGLDFPHPLGLAAGFDKDARVAGRMLALGFGFVEIGTVTPRPQPGNPRPRIFRLPADGALINRLGFNNKGLEVAGARLAARRGRGIVGANIGRNKDSSDAVADYVAGFRALAPHADYVTVNISSPNTPGLRDLQAVASLRPLLEALTAERAQAAGAVAQRPLLLKLAPDLADADAVAAAELALEVGLDGLIVSNTTIARPPDLGGPHAGESGGLSGRPLLARSTELLGIIHRETGDALPLVGVGGIASAADAYAKIRAGACLLQLYTALVYRGPALVHEIAQGLVALLRRDGFAGIEQARGVDAGKR